MPYLHPNGIEFCSGEAGVGVYYGQLADDASILQFKQLYPKAGSARWLNNQEIIFQEFSNGARIAAHSLETGQIRTIQPVGVTHLSTNKNNAWVNFGPTGVIDYLGRVFSESFINDNCMGLDGAYAIKVKYQSTGPWNFYPSVTQMTQGDASQVACYGDGIASWVENGIAHSIGMPTPNPLTKEFSWMRCYKISNDWWISYQAPKGFYFHPIGSTFGYMIPGSLFYNPDIVQINSTKIRVIWSIDAGGTQIMASNIDISSTRVDLSPPIEKPIDPVTPSRSADGRKYNIGSFLVGGRWPRSGPTHTQNQVVTPNSLIHWVKFGNPQAYETWAFDDNWIYHLEDASGDVYSFSDPRWFPRNMAIGESHAFITGPHQIIHRVRNTCKELRRDPVNRKMWLHALYDIFNWGPDLGEDATIVLAYDATGGIYAPDRYVELYYFSFRFGWCRWEAYHSNLVYANGPAQFPDSARSSRSDFYLVGGPDISPQLTGCVPQVCPKPPVPPKEKVMVGLVIPKYVCEEITNGDGTYSLSNGTYWMTIELDGSISFRQPADEEHKGPWERFTKSGNMYVELPKNGISRDLTKIAG